MNRHPLAPLLVPGSVAVAGASDDRATVGGALLRNLREGFRGPVFAVNPRHAVILGEKAWPSIAALPEPVDLALVATPPEAIPQVIEDCGRRGVRAAAILTAGLSEAIPGGARLTSETVSAARRHGVRLLGPNSIGLMRPALGLNATFASSPARAGPVALVAQSGALVSAVLDWADTDEVGFSSVVSLGNKLDVDFADVLDFLTLDAATESIVLYIEGIRSARKFMSALRGAARTKPVIVLKSGRERAGERAAQTHTRSLVGRDDVFDAALRRAGAVRVRTFVQLFSAAKCLSSRYRPAGNHLAVVTNGGGPGVMAADWANEMGIELPPLSPQTFARLERVLPPAWSRDNPVDLLEDADVGRYREAIEACLEDPAADGLLVILAPQSMTEPANVARALIECARHHTKHLFACWMGDRRVQEARALLAEARIPVFRTPEPAVEAFSNVGSFYQNQKLLMQVPGPLAHQETPDVESARTLIEAALAAGRGVLNEMESKTLLAAFRIPVARTVMAQTAVQAIMIAQQIGFPVAMKVSSPDIGHKAAVGGVRLNVGDAAEVRAAYEDILRAAGAAQPRARIEGVAIEPMVAKPRGREVLLGMFTDPLFGPVVAFGAGGADVELIADRAVALPPLNGLLARSLISRSRFGRRIAAQGGEAELAAIEGVLLRVSEIACELPWVREMDINPLIVDADGIIAADARIMIAPLPPANAADRYAHMAVYPYPTHLTRRWVTPDGVTVSIRAIRPEDAQSEKAFVRSLSEETRYFRFISALHELSDHMLVRFTQIDYDREMALVALAGDGGHERQIGVARYAIDPDGASCEFAIVVADDWQGRGVGWRLMQALIDAAREKGLRRMQGLVLHENTKMLALMKSLGFEIRIDPEDPSLKLAVKQLTAD